jgi:hypothetical protein
MVVSKAVRREVEARFKRRDAADVMRLLESVVLPGSEDGMDRDRIQFAILIVSRGDLADFARALALSVTDWRDLLVSAGLEHENWPEVLHAARITHD